MLDLRGLIPSFLRGDFRPQDAEMGRPLPNDVGMGSSTDPSSDDRETGLRFPTEIGIGCSEDRDARVSTKEAELIRKGLSVDEIDRIREKVPDLDVALFKPHISSSDEEICKEAADFAKDFMVVVMHSPTEVQFVQKGDTADQIKAALGVLREEKKRAFWTPERLAVKEAKLALQAAETALFDSEMEKALPKLPEYAQRWVQDHSDADNHERALAISLAKDAHLMARTLKTPENLRSWYDLKEIREMERAVPGFKDDKYSGFMLGQMAKLAEYFMDEMVRKAD